ncbi:MAG: helix-turn-helix domain-containing protein [Akkermansiaceae bacterium]|jgi:DNA-binding transcriptional ArsR family regulator|nr:helix-turn-helix domain-containing protein [Akkermansiaceae bacterium]MDP4779049.1 helix-turn-helix domain-containing protein [Akkermansiaceae bacterium]
MDTKETAASVPRVSLKTLSKVFATPERMRILRELAKGESLMTKELSARCKLLQSNTTKHLRILRESGIVLRGRANLYSINPIHLVPGQPGHIDLGTCLFRLVDAD